MGSRTEKGERVGVSPCTRLYDLWTDVGRLEMHWCCEVAIDREWQELGTRFVEHDVDSECTWHNAAAGKTQARSSDGI